jgi:hypothetical protein
MAITMRSMGRVSSGAGYKANAGKRKEEMKIRPTWTPNGLADHADNTEQIGVRMRKREKRGEQKTQVFQNLGRKGVAGSNIKPVERRQTSRSWFEPRSEVFFVISLEKPFALSCS